MTALSGCGVPIVAKRCSSCGRPCLVDAFSCAGGAGVGYHRAGFCVTGVDIVEQPRYPFHHVVADALEFLREHGREFTAAHGSPPCQASCALTKGNRKRDGWSDEHVDLIPATRAVFAELGIPSVMENVQGSSLRRDLVLCGDMFPGLEVIRHRYFELSGFFAMQPPHTRHRGRISGWNHGVKHDGPYFQVYGSGGNKGSVEDWQRAMGGMTWTSERHELAEAIPWPYAAFIGEAIAAELEQVAA